MIKNWKPILFWSLAMFFLWNSLAYLKLLDLSLEKASGRKQNSLDMKKLGFSSVNNTFDLSIITIVKENKTYIALMSWLCG